MYIHKYLAAWSLNPPSGRKIWDRCYDFLKIFAEKFGEKSGVFAQNKGKLCKKLIIALLVEKNANFLPKISKNRRKILIITSIPGSKSEVCTKPIVWLM
jgi:hypothetical protein